jgi:hypothetical protein
LLGAPHSCVVLAAGDDAVRLGGGVVCAAFVGVEFLVGVGGGVKGVGEDADGGMAGADVPVASPVVAVAVGVAFAQPAMVSMSEQAKATSGRRSVVTRQSVQD